MAKKEFQAESKKLMDMMINSIYTNKEIFLRELISNASDAIDKLYYKSLTDPSVGMNKGDFRILLTRDKDNRLLTVSDNGIGMTKEELEQNLGTIAHSGSLDFKKDNKDENIDIIGQFGVGFYSAFMVADKVTVISKAYGSDEAWQWESSGVDGYEMTPAQKDTVGTQIILHIKPDTDTEKYDNFLDEYGIVAIVKKYSDYVRYPIQMEREKSRQKPEPDPKPEDYKPEWETYTELETLNSMIPIWKKQKSEVTDEEYNSFYKDKFGDYADPARVIVSRTEGTANYNALLFVPSHRPYDFYTKDYEKGLALYASGVLIMEKCADLLPDYFSFVKGIVDSQDLSLNISREMLQKDSQLKLIHNALEKKIKNELHAMLNNDRAKYEEFWKEFGRQIKFGAYSDYGMHAELLRDLLLFWSAKEQKMVTLQEYIDKMPAEQKYIYFAAGDSTDRLAKLPSAELVLDKGFDVLLLTEDVDEFCLQILHSYPRKDAEGKDEHSRDSLERIIKDYNEMYGTNFSTDTFSAYHKDISDRVKGKKTKSLDILIVVNMFLTGFDSKQLSVLYVDKDLKYHDLLQAYSRTNRVEKETKPFGIIICYRNLKKRTDDALTLFSKSQDTSGIVVPGYQYFVEKFNEMVMKLKEIALFPESVDTMQNEDDQKKFVVTFRELTKYLQSLQTFIEFSFDQDALIMSEQEYQDYKSKYLMLYSRQKTDREVVSVLNDVDFCIELMESDRINVAYIMNLIRNIHFDDPKQKDYDIKHIKDELGRTDNPQLLRKVEILQAFLDRVVVGLESADEIDAAYNDFENEAKREEIVAFAKTEDIDASMLTDIISEYEFSGTMDAGNIRDRIEKPLPLLKKRSLVNRIVDFIRQHTEKYQ